MRLVLGCLYELRKSDATRLPALCLAEGKLTAIAPNKVVMLGLPPVLALAGYVTPNRV